MFKILSVKKDVVDSYDVEFYLKDGSKKTQSIQFSSPEKGNVDLMLNIFAANLDVHNGGDGLIYNLKTYGYSECPIGIELE